MSSKQYKDWDSEGLPLFHCVTLSPSLSLSEPQILVK